MKLRMYWSKWKHFNTLSAAFIEIGAEDALEADSDDDADDIGGK